MLRLLVAVSLLLVAACGPAAPAEKQVRGVLIDLQGASLQRFESFTLRTEDGRDLTFRPAERFNEGAAHPMSPGHLRQHMALGDPVLVTYREEPGGLVALRAEDG